MGKLSRRELGSALLVLTGARGAEAQSGEAPMKADPRLDRIESQVGRKLSVEERTAISSAIKGTEKGWDDVRNHKVPDCFEMDTQFKVTPVDRRRRKDG